MNRNNRAKIITNPNFYSIPWYYVDNSKNQQGPIDFFMLKKLIETKEISLKNYIWCEEWNEWKLLQEVSLLHPENPPTVNFK